MIKRASAHSHKTANWVDRYSGKHRPNRITDFPQGIEPPRKVRIYSRNGHYLLQFWEPGEKRSLSERIDGDLITAIVRARAIDDRLINFKRSGRKAKLEHEVLAIRFLEYQDQRCCAGEIDSETTDRYRSAIERHYLPFTTGPSARKFKTVDQANLDFKLAFSAHLQSSRVSPNGHANARPKLMTPGGRDFVMNVVRAMYCWAADLNRGNLLPDGFVNPFVGGNRSSTAVTPDCIQDLKITVDMAASLIASCDEFQLPIFATLTLYGLRPGELGWLFREHICKNWFPVTCKPELNYYTKGRRDKKFPLIPATIPSQPAGSRSQNQGLLFQNRMALAAGVRSESFSNVVEGHTGESGRQELGSPKQLRRLRDRLMKQHGQLNYDHVRREFEILSRELGWSTEATLKDLRHLFSTCLENAGVPTFFRKYMMGQSFGREAIVAYTHITEDKLRQHYNRAIETELAPIVQAITLRQAELAETT